VIFGRWLNRDESVSVTNNIKLQTPFGDTSSMPQNSDSVSVSSNIEDIQTQVTDTPDIPQTLNQAAQGWKGLRLKLRQGQDSAGSFYTELIARIGDAVGVADGEPVWNEYLSQWMVGVNFADGCKSVVCDWVVAV
jgi:hypothetical protein